ncbi:hypothetical protein [Psychrobacter sp. CAL346-MNA-CIBAN-0220]|uniref:hypothetical protein n=1 Tax=Psychrobacter sp. CAL346-MNA-CIBAN-0220 TaxID=3140457 RepID=UPI0033174763
MTMPFISKLAAGSCLAFLLTAMGCQSPTTTESEPKPNHQSSSNQGNSPSTLIKPDTSQQTLTQQALHIQQALASKDYASITDDIHPTRGVRFSMYAYVHLDKDKVFSRAQFSQYLEESKVRFTWGELDGVGEALVVPLPEYLDTWIDGKNYNNARITVNTFESRGNMINNVNEAYPQSDVVDFYYKGSDKYDGIDWRGMRLVFGDYQGKRYLIAIINDQWTV